MLACSTKTSQEQSVSKQEGDETGEQKILVLVTAETLGTGDPELGRKLMVNYLKTISEMGSDLWRLIFINGGVKLTTETSSF